jgi:Fic family protein
MRRVPGTRHVYDERSVGDRLRRLQERFGDGARHAGVPPIAQLHAEAMDGAAEASSPRSGEVAVTCSSLRMPVPDQVPGLVAELERWLHATPGTDVVATGCAAHARLVEIHPFEDGNGRTARALVNAVLAAGGYPPIDLTRERGTYLEAVTASVSGDLTALIDLVAQGLDQAPQRRPFRLARSVGIA